MRKLLLFFCLCLPILLFAQKGVVNKKYLAGAVPVVEGEVVFQKEYQTPRMSKAQIFEQLKKTGEILVKSENQTENSRISTSDGEHGLLALNMEEFLYFRRSAWVTNYTRFFYQLLFQIKEGGYTVSMRNIHYSHDEENYGGKGLQYDAEDWITDGYALVNGGKKLSRQSGKFRKFTIDRKDQLFKIFNNSFTGKK